MIHGLIGIPLAQTLQTRRDYTSDQGVRWCPDYGDYVAPSTFQATMADLGITRENTVVVSDTGCSSRFLYYADCYGMHSTHGRATAITTGVAAVREDLNVWVIAGNSNAPLISGNRLVHMVRRNMSISILLFNNRIYGLTKRQYSPTPERDKLARPAPYGSSDIPFNLAALALGTRASLVTRTVNSGRAQLAEAIDMAARHRSAILIEIYQNCPISSNETFGVLKGPESVNALIRLRDGKPVVFGTEEQFHVVREPGGGLRITETATATPERIAIHNVGRRDPSQVFALVQLTDHGVMHRAPAGTFRQMERPIYGDPLRTQVVEARTENPHDTLQAAMSGKIFWKIV